VGGGRLDERVDPDPATFVESEPDPLRLVSQVFGEVLGHSHGTSFVHAVSVPGETRVTHVILIPMFDPQRSAFIHRGIADSVDNSPPNIG
jgi:hypothetical protein